MFLSNFERSLLDFYIKNLFESINNSSELASYEQDKTTLIPAEVLNVLTIKKIRYFTATQV